jgi:hypothetical protein
LPLESPKIAQERVFLTQQSLSFCGINACSERIESDSSRMQTITANDAECGITGSATFMVSSGGERLPPGSMAYPNPAVVERLFAQVQHGDASFAKPGNGRTRCTRGTPICLAILTCYSLIRTRLRIEGKRAAS